MILLLSGLWPGLLAAIMLGLACGRFAGPPGRVVPLSLAALFLALAGTALSGLVTGVAGLWVESAALLFGVYLAGCGLGGLLRQRPPAAPGA